MRLPRDISGDDLVRELHKYGYQVTRQTGSHLRLTRSSEGKEFHLTIPKHNPLRVGTLNHILKDLSEHLNIDKNLLIKNLLSR